jgi:ABC-type transporter Mla subunit MlaD
MSNLPVGPTLPGTFEAANPRPTTGFDNAAVETVGQTIRHAAGAVEGLRDILERLDTSIARAVDHRQTEEHFGQLFIRAQAFVDASIAEAQDRARRLVLESEREASRIVAAARDEAARIVEEGRRSSAMPVEAAHQLQTTVEHFGEVNRELLQELTALGQLLTGRPPAQPTPQPALSGQYPARAAVASNGQLPAQNGHQPAPPAPPPPSSAYWDAPRHAAAAPPRVQTNGRGSASRAGRWRRNPGH